MLAFDIFKGQFGGLLLASVVLFCLQGRPIHSLFVLDGPCVLTILPVATVTLAVLTASCWTNSQLCTASACDVAFQLSHLI